MHKCHKCVFKGEFRDTDGNVPVCNRSPNLQNAIYAYNRDGPCQWHITWQELIDLQEKMLTMKTSINAGTGKGDWTGNMWDM